MDYANVIDQAVKQFYAEGNNDVHSWLLKVQTSPEAWTFVWDLLHSSKVMEYITLSMGYWYLIGNNSPHFYHSQEKHSFMRLPRYMPKFPSNGMKCPRVNILFCRSV